MTTVQTFNISDGLLNTPRPDHRVQAIIDKYGAALHYAAVNFASTIAASVIQPFSVWNLLADITPGTQWNKRRGIQIKPLALQIAIRVTQTTMVSNPVRPVLLRFVIFKAQYPYTAVSSPQAIDIFNASNYTTCGTYNPSTICHDKNMILFDSGEIVLSANAQGTDTAMRDGVYSRNIWLDLPDFTTMYRVTPVTSTPDDVLSNNLWCMLFSDANPTILSIASSALVYFLP